MKNLKAILGRLTDGFRTGRRVSPEDLSRLVQEKFDFKRFAQVLGYRPRNWRYFVEAMLHRSSVQHLEPGWRSNERLEFLGDAVLNFLVADFLHRQNPSMEEGDLTKVRSRIVNRKVLAQRARGLHLSEFLLLSASASQSIDQGSESILSDALEALIGAVYLDGGPDAAREFVQRILLSHEIVLAGSLTDDNYKSALLEYSQARSLGIPRYTVVREEGPDHDRRFTVEVSVGTRCFGTGMGRSKKDAEQAAAARALEHIQLNQTSP